MISKFRKHVCVKYNFFHALHIYSACQDIGAILHPCQYPIEQWCPSISILLVTMRNMSRGWRAESNAEKGEIRKEKNNLYGSKGFSRNWSALHPFYYLLLMFKKIFLVFILYLFSSCVYYFICFASQSVDLGWRFHHPITTNYNYPQLISTWVRSVTAR